MTPSEHGNDSIDPFDGVRVLNEGETPESAELSAILRDTLEEALETGEAPCNMCDYVAEGDSIDALLEDLGEHGEAEHPEVVGDA